MSLRLLVTGSRRWVHLPSVAETLSFYTRLAFEHGSRLEVVHGAARDGADALAAGWVSRHSRRGWPVSADPHPANWSAPCGSECRHGPRGVRKNGSEYCQFAGHRRNSEMVDSGVQACVAFWHGGSPGTRDCFTKAEGAGLEPLVLKWEQREEITNGWLLLNAPDFRVVTR